MINVCAFIVYGTIKLQYIVTDALHVSHLHMYVLLYSMCMVGGYCSVVNCVMLVYCEWSGAKVTQTSAFIVYNKQSDWSIGGQYSPMGYVYHVYTRLRRFTRKWLICNSNHMNLSSIWKIIARAAFVQGNSRVNCTQIHVITN